MPNNTPALAWLRATAEGTDDTAGHARAVLEMVEGLEGERDTLTSALGRLYAECMSAGFGYATDFGWPAAMRSAYEALTIAAPYTPLARESCRRCHGEHYVTNGAGEPDDCPRCGMSGVEPAPLEAVEAGVADA